MPSFDLWAWLLFPFATLTHLRTIVASRANALTAASTASNRSNPAVRPSKLAAKPANATVSADISEPANTNANQDANLPNAAPDPANTQDNVVSMADRPAPREVRAWAQANGYKIGDRARIPGEIWEAYRAASG
jgi:hypothetical protein